MRSAWFSTTQHGRSAGSSLPEQQAEQLELVTDVPLHVFGGFLPLTTLSSHKEALQITTVEVFVCACVCMCARACVRPPGIPTGTKPVILLLSLFCSPEVSQMVTSVVITPYDRQHLGRIIIVSPVKMARCVLFARDAIHSSRQEVIRTNQSQPKKICECLCKRKTKRPGKRLCKQHQVH